MLFLREYDIDVGYNGLIDKTIGGRHRGNDIGSLVIG